MWFLSAFVCVCVCACVSAHSLKSFLKSSLTPRDYWYNRSKCLITHLTPATLNWKFVRSPSSFCKFLYYPALSNNSLHNQMIYYLPWQAANTPLLCSTGSCKLNSHTFSRCLSMYSNDASQRGLFQPCEWTLSLQLKSECGHNGTQGSTGRFIIPPRDVLSFPLLLI